MIPCPHCDDPSLLGEVNLDGLHQDEWARGLRASTTLSVACKRCPFRCEVPYVILDPFEEFVGFMKMLVFSYYELWLSAYLKDEHALVQLAKIAGYDRPDGVQ